MFEDSENKLLQQEKTLNELLLRIERLDEEIEDYLGGHQVNTEQLSRFVSEKANFGEANWNEMQKRKLEQDQKLKCELENISNPLRLKKAYKQRQVQPHWLFVR